MNELKTLHSMGFNLPSPAYLFGLILFGFMGYAVYRYGKKSSHLTTRWGGIALMIYPYAITETWQLYAVGVALCIGVYGLRR
jgi:hypothetical protein